MNFLDFNNNSNLSDVFDNDQRWSKQPELKIEKSIGQFMCITDSYLGHLCMPTKKKKKKKIYNWNKRRLWFRLYFSSGAQNVLFALFGWFVRWEVGVDTIAFLCGATSWN